MIAKRLGLTMQRLIVRLGLAFLFACGGYAFCLASENEPVGQVAVDIPAAKAVGTVYAAAAPGTVTLRRQNHRFRLYRDGRPYFIKGVGGRRYMGMAAEAGANSIRTWGAHDAGSLLENAGEHGMTVMLGIWLSHDPVGLSGPGLQNPKNP